MLKIKEYRKQKGVTQSEFAKELNIAQSTLSQYESGDREPNIPTLVHIAEILDITVDELIDIQKAVNKRAENFKKQLDHYNIENEK